MTKLIVKPINTQICLFSKIPSSIPKSAHDSRFFHLLVLRVCGFVRFYLQIVGSYCKLWQPQIWGSYLATTDLGEHTFCRGFIDPAHHRIGVHTTHFPDSFHPYPTPYSTTKNSHQKAESIPLQLKS